ncbi:MAG: hypothetical protein ACE15D_14295 [Candidatus Eisenbacteria bacterium]
MKPIRSSAKACRWGLFTILMVIVLICGALPSANPSECLAKIQPISMAPVHDGDGDEWPEKTEPPAPDFDLSRNPEPTEVPNDFSVKGMRNSNHPAPLPVVALIRLLIFRSVFG